MKYKVDVFYKEEPFAKGCHRDWYESKNEPEMLNGFLILKDVDVVGIKNGVALCFSDSKEEIFVSLTPAQANSLQKKINDNVELNQNIFIAYIYEMVEEGEKVEYIGVGFKVDQKPAKTFEDFEKESEEEEEIQEED